MTRVSLGEKVLLLLSRKPGASDYATEGKEWNVTSALSLLRDVFPGFMKDATGKEILDFGCGLGWQVLALAKTGSKCAVGIDINSRALEQARRSAESLGLGKQVEFHDKLHARFGARFDLVISQNSMEHFRDPAWALDQMKSALKDGGAILITFAPTWFSPYGSHMHFFTKVPWVNVLFREKTVMRVRARFRSDGAVRYEQVEGGLNRMSVAKFERIVGDSGLKVHYIKYDCVKGIKLLASVPILRELFVCRISCVLRKRQPARPWEI